MPLPRPHELNQFIEFINVGAPFNSATGVGREISVFASGWARIRDLGGSIEEQDQQHRLQKQEFDICLMYIEGLTGFMQIKWGDRVLLMTEPPQKVTDAQSRRWWLIAALETIELEVS